MTWNKTIKPVYIYTYTYINIYIYTYIYIHIYIYSQTCLNNHLHKTTTRLRQPVMSPPKQIPIQLLPYKTTTCLTQPATTFLFPKWKKPCLKWPLQNFIQRRNGKQSYRNNAWKTNVSLILFTLLLLYNVKFV